MNSILRFSALMVFSGLALVAAPKADAAFVPPGTQALVDLGPTTLVGSQDINQATGFVLNNLVTTLARSGGFTAAGVQNFSFAATTFNIASPQTFSFGNAVFGTFQGISSSPGATSATSQEYLITGTFLPGTVFADGGPLTATFDVTFSQVGGINTAVSASGTLLVPASVPEPASIALVGLGLVGVAGFSARRRSAK
jgi:hypothetical protein